jgi:hypothetical protein
LTFGLNRRDSTLIVCRGRNRLGIRSRRFGWFEELPAILFPNPVAVFERRWLVQSHRPAVRQFGGKRFVALERRNDANVLATQAADDDQSAPVRMVNPAIAIHVN